MTDRSEFVNKVAQEISQEIWQAYVVEVGRSLPAGLADKMAQAAIDAMPGRCAISGPSGRQEKLMTDRSDLTGDFDMATAIKRLQEMWFVRDIERMLIDRDEADD